jgi:transcriptional regulator with XRE-family HTH domain
MSFGSRIVSVRRKQKLSQSDLATRVGLHANVLGRYERDEAIPSVEIAARIAKALEISLDYLIELTEVELDPVTLKRIQDITSLSDEDREHVFKVVDALIRDAKAKK